MILLMGNNRDDLLYFETVINNRKDETVLGKYPVMIGTIANQAVMLLKGVYTNVLSSLITSYLIEKYYILFVIRIGRVSTLSNTLNNGDVVVEKTVKALDVDITDLQGTQLGQMPGFDTEFELKNEIYSTIVDSFVKRTSIIVKDCVALSNNTHYTNPDQVKPMIFDEKIMSEEINSVVFDSEAFGIATACQIYDIPYVGIGVILNHIGEEFDTNGYVTVLKQYANIGKAVVNAIGEIGSNEVLRG